MRKYSEKAAVARQGIFWENEILPVKPIDLYFYLIKEAQIGFDL